MSLFSRKYVDDVFISWLLFVNAGMIDHGNIFMFDYVIKNLPSKNPLLK